MDSIIAAEIAQLQNMTVTSLAEKFESLIGEKCRSRNKRYLIRRIAWRLQANAEGGLSELALKRAAELALDSEVRVTPPKHSRSSQAIISAAASFPVRDSRLPPNGSHRVLSALKGRVFPIVVPVRLVRCLALSGLLPHWAIETQGDALGCLISPLCGDRRFRPVPNGDHSIPPVTVKHRR